MNFVLFLIVVALFYVLVPGILVVLPPKSSKHIVALTHALVFGIILAIIHKPIWKATQGWKINNISLGIFQEGMETEDTDTDTDKPNKKK